MHEKAYETVAYLRTLLDVSNIKITLIKISISSIIETIYYNLYEGDVCAKCFYEVLETCKQDVDDFMHCLANELETEKAIIATVSSSISDLMIEMKKMKLNLKYCETNQSIYN